MKKEAVRALQAKPTASQLSAQQRSLLVEALAAHKGNHVKLLSIMGDAEGKRLASDLAAALAEGGWIIDSQGSAHHDVDPVGLVVAVQDENNAPWAAVHLIKALVAAGIQAEYGANGSIAPSVVEVRIGTKADR